MRGIMLDLETMGNGSNAAITAIGAVKFDSESKCWPISGHFYKIVSLKSSMVLGGEADASTIIWWLTQSEQARSIYNKEEQKFAIELPAALDLFNLWLTADEDGDHMIWGNGLAFDNVILTNAYKRLNKPSPWKYYNDRCYRTLKGLYSDTVKPDKLIGVKHNAVDDAENQARHLIKILKHMGL